MFITFEFLLGTCSTEKIEIVVSTPKEAAAFAFFLETTERVRAFKMIPYSPSDLGMAPNNTWVKYRETGFTQEDYYDKDTLIGQTNTLSKTEDNVRLEIVKQVLNNFKAPDVHKG